MKTLKLLLTRIPSVNCTIAPLMIMLIGVLLWQTLPLFLSATNPTVGLVDGGIWQLLLFSMCGYLLFLSMSVMLFNWFLTRLALPTINSVVLQFNTLTLWQQLGFYWAFFALLFLGALLSLVAIF